MVRDIWWKIVDTKNILQFQKNPNRLYNLPDVSSLSDVLNRDHTTATSTVQRVPPMRTETIWMPLESLLQAVPGMGVISHIQLWIYRKEKGL
jgi:hypothetical protein